MAPQDELLLLPGDGSAADQARVRLPAGWPLFAILLLMPVWYVLGLGAFIWMILAVPLAARLVLAGRWRIPRGFLLWLLFLAWTGVSALQVVTATNWLTYWYRAAAYLAATVVFLYLANTRDDELPARRIINGFTFLWVIVVAGGFAALAFPHLSFSTPVQKLLPGAFLSNRLLYGLVHPSLAQAQALGGTAVIGHAITRPAAPFAYTNWWGATYAMLTPFVILSIRWVGSRVIRLALAGVLAASLAPFVLSVNRGAWLSVVVGLLYTLVRLAGRRRGRATLGLLALLAVFVVAVIATPLGSVVRDRLGHAGSEELRLSLYQQSIQDARNSPVVGYGVPRPQLVSQYTLPNVGTQGQLWLVLVSVGLPGTFFFLAWLLYLFWTSRRAAGGVSFAVHVAMLIAIVQLPFYGWLPAEMFLVMAAGGLLWRGPDPAVAAAAPQPAALART